MSAHPNPPQGKHDIADVQSALYELHEGLMSLKASLMELARTQDEEVAMREAHAETAALLDRIRRRA